MTTQHTPGPWYVGVSTDRGAKPGRVHVLHVNGGSGPYRNVAVAEREEDAPLLATAPALLTLAHQYATECGECAGTRVCPDDEPCTECQFIWDVINKAEGRS